MTLHQAARTVRPVRINKSMTDHSQDPFFVKKTEAAKKRLKKLKFPPELEEMSRIKS
ncbi:MAG: hypothetical protein P4L51_10755 [Puia sp.]|nr:hypothetical protein [Puia sp.]